MSSIVAYCDGGVFLKNPSEFGGSWAWCHIRGEPPSSEVLAHAAGYVLRDDPILGGNEFVTNNFTEFLAALFCLEALHDGWSGQLWTDSLITLKRIRNPKPDSFTAVLGKKLLPVTFPGIPSALVERLEACKQRLGDYTVHLLGGHPTRQELKDGRRKDGKIVSKWNVWCDKLCADQYKKFQETVNAK